MKSSSFSFPDPQGVSVFVYKWLPDGRVKAVIQIAHGMAEHAARYERFAKTAAKAGYAVYANDHRGHGKTAGGLENVGYPGSRDGFAWMVKDMAQLTEIIRNDHPGRKVILLGHSMGSLLAQQYMADHGNLVNGVILSGTSGPLGMLPLAGKILAAVLKAVQGPKKKSLLLNFMTFGPYNDRFKPNRTFFDWLSRDEREVDKYVNDPYCGGVFTTEFFYQLAKGTIGIHDPAVMRRIPKKLPVLMVSGEWCPVGLNTKTVKKLTEMYGKLGLREVRLKIYPGARHELLNETNRDEVTQDLIGWMNGIV